MCFFVLLHSSYFSVILCACNLCCQLARQVITSGQRILTKGRIAPALVTPAAGESTLKPRFRRDALSLLTSMQPRAAAVFAAYAFQWERKTPKTFFLWEGSGPPPNTWFFGSTRVYSQSGISIVSVGFTFVSNRHTDHIYTVSQKNKTPNSCV